MTEKILVTGATGTIGQVLVKQLQQKQAHFTVGSRDVENAKKKLGLSGNVVRFSFDEPATFEAATNNVNCVFLLGPPLVLNMEKLIIPFLDFLGSKNIKRVVYLSAMGADQMKELSFHGIMENKLKSDGFDYTILRPAFFAQNFKTYEAESILQRSILFQPAGSGKVAFVDVKDIAAVAAAALTESGHSKKTYEITGPETLSYYDAATQLSEILGKTITYLNPNPQEYTEALKAAGAPDFIAPYMVSVYSAIANNQVNRVSLDVELVTGKKPGSLKEVLKSDF